MFPGLMRAGEILVSDTNVAGFVNGLRTVSDNRGNDSIRRAGVVSPDGRADCTP